MARAKKTATAVNEREQVLADACIGAAQALELAARQLRDRARMVREHGVPAIETPEGIEKIDNVEWWAQFGVCDVRKGASSALAEIAPLAGRWA